MKGVSICLGILALLAIPSVRPYAQSNDESVVAALDTEYQAAVQRNDTATMDRILADDFVLVTGRGAAYTKADLLKMYGEPTQVGMKDGDQTWTWYYFKKGSGKDGDLSKQLEATFNPQGVVKSYSFSSNFPEDMKTR